MSWKKIVSTHNSTQTLEPIDLTGKYANDPNHAASNGIFGGSCANQTANVAAPTQHQCLCGTVDVCSDPAHTNETDCTNAGETWSTIDGVWNAATNVCDSGTLITANTWTPGKALKVVLDDTDSYWQTQWERMYDYETYAGVVNYDPHNETQDTGLNAPLPANGLDDDFDWTAATNNEMISAVNISLTTDAWGHPISLLTNISTRTIDMYDIGWTVGNTDLNANWFVHDETQTVLDTGGLQGTSVLTGRAMVSKFKWELDSNTGGVDNNGDTLDTGGSIVSANSTIPEYATRNIEMWDLGYLSGSCSDPQFSSDYDTATAGDPTACLAAAGTWTMLADPDYYQRWGMSVTDIPAQGNTVQNNYYIGHELSGDYTGNVNDSQGFWSSNIKFITGETGLNGAIGGIADLSELVENNSSNVSEDFGIKFHIDAGTGDRVNQLRVGNATTIVGEASTGGYVGTAGFLGLDLNNSGVYQGNGSRIGYVSMYQNIGGIDAYTNSISNPNSSHRHNIESIWNHDVLAACSDPAYTDETACTNASETWDVGNAGKLVRTADPDHVAGEVLGNIKFKTMDITGVFTSLGGTSQSLTGETQFTDNTLQLNTTVDEDGISTDTYATEISKILMGHSTAASGSEIKNVVSESRLDLLKGSGTAYKDVVAGDISSWVSGTVITGAETGTITADPTGLVAGHTTLAATGKLEADVFIQAQEFHINTQTSIATTESIIDETRLIVTSEAGNGNEFWFSTGADPEPT